MIAKSDLVFEWTNGQLRVGVVGVLVLVALTFGWWRS